MGERGGPRELKHGPVANLLAESVQLGIEPRGWTPSARWEREADIQAEVYFAAGGM